MSNTSEDKSGQELNDQATPRRLYLALAHTRKRLNLLAQVSQLFLGSAPLSELAQELTRNICEAFDVDACVIRVLDGNELVLLAETGVPTSRSAIRMATNEGIAAQIIREHRPIVLENVETHPVTSELHQRSVASGPANKYVFLSYAGAPMMIGSRMLGILGVYIRTTHRKFEESEVDYLQIMANHVAVAVTGHRLYEELDQDHQRLNDSFTRRDRAESQLAHNAMFDSLTGLPNRRQFIQHARHSLAIARRNHRSDVAMLFLDLDSFKLLNESFGHDVGDRFLSIIARDLERVLRSGDLLARCGGDEFAVLLEDVTDRAHVRMIISQIRGALSKSFEIEGHEIVTSASIGVVMSAADYEEPEVALRDAEIAMHRDKQTGSDSCVFFEPAMHVWVRRQLSLATDLHKAIRNGEFEPYFQPLFGACSGQTEGFEALLRWNHSIRGMIYPGEFIPIAEETPLIRELGRFVLVESCRRLAEWKRLGVSSKDHFMTVNVSPRQLEGATLIEDVLFALRESSLDGASLRLEITESVLMSQAESTVEMLSNLRDHGVDIWMDDFGTGYSSLSNLEHLPITTLKIDRIFVQRMKHNGTSRMLSAIAQLARTLELDLVAEGVESGDQVEPIREMGYRYLQGYHLASPMPAAAAQQFIAALPSGMASSE